MLTLTKLLNPQPRKSSISQRRENIDELFTTTIYRRPVITKIYDKVNRVVKDHSKAKSRTRQILNILS
jgi:hypothetical protein